jgi:hypothetical protein
VRQAAVLVALLTKGAALITCLTLSTVLRIAHEATRAHEQFVPLAAVPAAGGSSYTELLLRVRGPHSLMTIGLFRDVSESQLRSTISFALRARASELGFA